MQRAPGPDAAVHRDALHGGQLLQRALQVVHQVLEGPQLRRLLGAGAPLMRGTGLPADAQRTPALQVPAQ